MACIFKLFIPPFQERFILRSIERRQVGAVHKTSHRRLASLGQLDVVIQEVSGEADRKLDPHLGPLLNQVYQVYTIVSRENDLRSTGQDLRNIRAKILVADGSIIFAHDFCVRNHFGDHLF